MRYIGLVAPISAIAAMLFGARALWRRSWFRSRLLPAYAITLVILGLGLATPVSNHLAYALPWRLPDHVHYRGRDYIRGFDSGCQSRTITHQADGWVLGYFTASKEIYATIGTPTQVLV